MLQKIGNAQLNIFCTALSHNFMVTPRPLPIYQSWLYHVFVWGRRGCTSKVRLDYLTYMLFLGVNVEFVWADLVKKVILVSNPTTVEAEVILRWSCGCDRIQQLQALTINYI